MKSISDDTKLVVFADDTSAIITSDNTKDLEKKINFILCALEKWFL